MGKKATAIAKRETRMMFVRVWSIHAMLIFIVKRTTGRFSFSFLSSPRVFFSYFSFPTCTLIR